MKELLEQVLTQATLKQMWLTPKGKEEELTASDHTTDAIRRLIKFKGGTPTLADADEYDAASERALNKFLKRTGYIRMAMYNNELDISVGSKVTSVQLAEIGKLVREHPKFYWDIYNPWKKEKKSKDGKGFREFVSALRSYDLLEVRESIREKKEYGNLLKAIYRVYKDNLRRLDPNVDDLDIALNGMLEYFKNFIDYWKKHPERTDYFAKSEQDEFLRIRPQFRQRHEELVNALSISDIQTKMITLDNAINQVHNDLPILKQIEIGKGEDIQFLVKRIEQIRSSLERKKVSESSIDFPQKDLDLDVWNKENNIYIIKPEVKRKILGVIDKYPDMDLIDIAAAGISKAATIHIVGSIATNQYLDTSDIDVHIAVSKDADFHGDEVFQKKIGTWFNVNRDEIDGYIEKHPIEVYLQYNPAQDLMSDGVYDLLADKWIIRPKIAPSNYDPYSDFSHIADDIRNAVQNADVLLGELKRDVIDYDVIKQAITKMSGEDKEHFLKNLQDKLIEIENDIKTLYSKRKEWVTMRHFASKPETPEQALSDVKLVKKWRDTNALFKFINRYKYLKIIGDLVKLLDDEKIDSWEIDTIKSIVGAR